MHTNKSFAGISYHVTRNSLLVALLLAPCAHAVQLNDTQQHLDSLFTTITSNCDFSASNQFENALASFCDLGTSPEESPEDAIRAISPEQIISMGTMATRTTAGQSELTRSGLAERFRAFRLGGGSGLFSYYGGGSRDTRYAAADSGARGGAAGDDGFSRLGFWLKGDTNFGNVDQTFEQNGFQYHNFGFTGGADYRITDSWLAGLAFTYGRSMTDFDQSRGSTNSNAYTGSIYTTLNITDSFHLDGTGSFGGLDYRTTRSIRFPGFVGQADGDVGGNQYTFSFGGGYDYAIGPLTLAPYARTDYIGLDIDGFSERGGNGFAMRFGDQRVRSLTSTAGAQVSYALSMPWGVLVPQVRGEWHHQFLDDRRGVAATFIGDPTATPITVNSAGPDRDFYTFGAEVSGTFARGVSAFLAYDTLLGYRNIDNHKFVVGGRLEF